MGGRRSTVGSGLMTDRRGEGLSGRKASSGDADAAKHPTGPAVRAGRPMAGPEVRATRSLKAN